MTLLAPQDQIEILRRLAPGTELRDAVDLILRQGTGALVILGNGAAVESMCSGGFFLDGAEFTAQRLAELAKMDGGIVLDEDNEYIVRANVHFIPDPTLATDETGTRFRTAERLSQQTDRPILAISEEGRSIAVVYWNGTRRELRPPQVLEAEANQRLISLERLRRRLQEAEDRLTRSEVDDVVIVRDVSLLLLRAALVRRLYADVERTVIELGGEGQLISLQAADLIEGVNDLAETVYQDYSKRRPRNGKSVFDRLQSVPTEDLYVASRVAAAIGMDPLDAAVRPRGIRALSRVPRLPDAVKDALISHFKDFQRMVHAPVADLGKVEGVGSARAEQLRSYFDRLLEVGMAWRFEDDGRL
jgi:diadenylate cyclase